MTILSEPHQGQSRKNTGTARWQRPSSDLAAVCQQPIRGMAAVRQAHHHPDVGSHEGGSEVLARREGQVHGGRPLPRPHVQQRHGVHVVVSAPGAAACGQLANIWEPWGDTVLRHCASSRVHASADTYQTQLRHGIGSAGVFTTTVYERSSIRSIRARAISRSAWKERIAGAARARLLSVLCLY